MVYNLLNRLKWTNKLMDCEVVVLHRGAKDNKKTIPGTRITEIKKGYFLYSKDSDKKQEVYIPMHRILEVRLENRTVWKKSLNH
jgi:uncharacterized protein (UPF0248 family)